MLLRASSCEGMTTPSPVRLFVLNMMHLEFRKGIRVQGLGFVFGLGYGVCFGFRVWGLFRV